MKTMSALQMLDLQRCPLLTFAGRVQPYINDVPQPAQRLSPQAKLQAEIIALRHQLTGRCQRITVSGLSCAETFSGFGMEVSDDGPCISLSWSWTSTHAESSVSVSNGELTTVWQCRMFKQAMRGAGLPKNLSSDHDPLYRSHQWKANLRVLGVTEIKTVPNTLWSHPFIERLIGTIRRECLDQMLFWTATDLTLKLNDFQDYYNKYRTHAALKGRPPTEMPECKGAGFERYRWQKHCRGLYQTPIAA